MSVKDYLAAQTVEPEDAEQAGVKGMKWGVRRSAKELKAASKERADSPDHVKNAGLKAATGEETSAMRYERLKAVAKAGKGGELSDEDIKFVNNRTEALKKINALNEQKEGWLSKTTKTVLQNAAQKQMQQLADTLSEKYIGAPVSESITGKAAKAAAEKKAKDAAEAVKAAKAVQLKERELEIAKVAAEAAAAKVKLDSEAAQPKPLFEGN